ncbi:hypothetical protein FNF31_02458 [Cafeteria roenbergensis]|uniref:KATNIP domain-containing protein n=1 Tax=Cafeteria roenbergensis TaxID=33653 RepID=A0A5A8DIP4_CAFRO|nr:hypothetical protein FNF31_02458 [Cafeteria roenbergensis]KAA0164989.1 hypothetical protein FNF28_03612 [Cafeteria roenbergensis]
MRRRDVASTPRASNASRAAAGGASLANVSMVDVPVLPVGSSLTLTVRSTWGDPHYVGLSGIDLFDDKGRRVLAAGFRQDGTPSQPVTRKQTGDRVEVSLGAPPPGPDSPAVIVAAAATPGDVNVLDGYGTDPRTVDKLVDGHGFTRDDLHSWLAPWTPGASATIELVLSKPVSLSMVRVWNYNKSRVHSFRGARSVRMAVDGFTVFDGEVRKAPGDLTDAAQCAECVLFTTDPAVLGTLFGDTSGAKGRGTAAEGAGQDPEHEWTAEAMREDAVRMLALRRPDTADDTADAGAAGKPGRAASAGRLRRRRRGPQPEERFEDALKAEAASPASGAAAGAGGGDTDLQALLREAAGLQSGSAAGAGAGDASPEFRPRTGAVRPAPPRRDLSSAPSGLTDLDSSAGGAHVGRRGAEAGGNGGSSGVRRSVLPLGAQGRWSPWDVAPCAEGCIMEAKGLPRARVLEMELVDTHGDPYYAGLSALRVLAANDSSGEVEDFPLSASMLSASPKDINVDGHSGDPRTLDKLVDGVDVTCDDTHMWLVPYTEGERHWLRVDLGRTVSLAGIVLYNYNKSADDASRGVRTISLALDGRPVFARAAGHPATNDSSDPGAPVWSRGLPVRAAPGHVRLPFSQAIGLSLPVPADKTPSGAAAVVVDATHGAAARSLPEAAAETALRIHRGMGFLKWPVRLVSEPSLWPRAQTVLLVIEASIADLYYVGLDDVALYDAGGRRLRVTPRQVSAVPDSINDLGATTGASAPRKQDGRVPASLAFDPTVQPKDPAIGPVGTAGRGRRPWLAPLSHSLHAGTHNSLQFALDAPVTLGAIRVRNYSKTHARGAAALDVWLDGRLAYSGPLKSAKEEGQRGQLLPLSPLWPAMEEEKKAGALALAPGPGTAAARAADGSDHVLLWDEKRRRGGPQAAPMYTAAIGVAPDLAARPGTAVAWTQW